MPLQGTCQGKGTEVMPRYCGCDVWRGMGQESSHAKSLPSTISKDVRASGGEDDWASGDALGVWWGRGGKPVVL